MKKEELTNIESIKEGWSADKKYSAIDEDGSKYLLRIAPKEQAEKKKLEFEMMQKVSELGIPMCQPIEFGSCEEGAYTLHSWIYGEAAEKVIPSLPNAEQYQYGLDAGRILKKIHSIPAPSTVLEWEIYFNQKINRKIKMYSDSPLHYKNGECFLTYINGNRSLLKGRPQCFQHGDYHIGNMMVNQENTLVIIDFDRYDFGDPWEEFNRIVWCAQISPLFASGMVDGYFEHLIPMEFWKLLALYIASNTLSSLPWAIPFGEKEIQTMYQQGEEILAWYDDMKNPIPSWYCQPKHK